MSRRLKVLLVDDEAIVGKRLKPALTKIGCDVEAFDAPKEALARLEQRDFDVVVADIRMREVDGIEILERVLARSPRTKVVLMTGYAMMATAREAMEKGAFDFIAKPFEPDDLREIVARAAAALGFDEGRHESDDAH